MCVKNVKFRFEVKKNEYNFVPDFAFFISEIYCSTFKYKRKPVRLPFVAFMSA